MVSLKPASNYFFAISNNGLYSSKFSHIVLVAIFSVALFLALVFTCLRLVIEFTSFFTPSLFINSSSSKSSIGSAIVLTSPDSIF